MQPGFKASEYVLTEVIQEIECARQRGWPIVVAEYRDYPSTYREILHAMQDLPHIIVTKDTWSAAPTLLNACHSKGWESSIIRLCGVNTNECVADTAEELISIAPQSYVDVVMEACFDQVINWELFPKHKNIRLRHQGNPCLKRDHPDVNQIDPQHSTWRKTCMRQARHGLCRHARSL